MANNVSDDRVMTRVQSATLLSKAFDKEITESQVYGLQRKQILPNVITIGDLRTYVRNVQNGDIKTSRKTKSEFKTYYVKMLPAAVANVERVAGVSEIVDPTIANRKRIADRREKAQETTADIDLTL